MHTCLGEKHFPARFISLFPPGARTLRCLIMTLPLHMLLVAHAPMCSWRAFIILFHPEFCMPTEHSCGFIVFREPEQGKRYYLLLHYKAGHWDFSKGHVEEGETEEETAQRELREETGISTLEIIPGFIFEYDYVFGQDGKRRKKVTFRLARTAESSLRFSHEHQGGRWVTFSRALKMLTFENARAMLEAAEKSLNSRAGSPK